MRTVGGAGRCVKETNKDSGYGEAPPREETRERSGNSPQEKSLSGRNDDRPPQTVTHSQIKPKSNCGIGLAPFQIGETHLLSSGFTMRPIGNSVTKR